MILSHLYFIEKERLTILKLQKLQKIKETPIWNNRN